MKWQRCLHTDATRSRSTAEVSAGPRCSSRGGGTDCGSAQGRCRARCHRVTLHEALRSDAGSLARRRTCLQKVRSRGPDPRCLRSQRGGPVPRAAKRGYSGVRGPRRLRSSTVVTLNAQGSDQNPYAVVLQFSCKWARTRTTIQMRSTRRSTWPHRKPRGARAARRVRSREHEESDPAHQRRLVMRELCSDLLMARRGG